MKSEAQKAIFLLKISENVKPWNVLVAIAEE